MPLVFDDNADQDFTLREYGFRPSDRCYEIAFAVEDGDLDATEARAALAGWPPSILVWIDEAIEARRRRFEPAVDAAIVDVVATMTTAEAARASLPVDFRLSFDRKVERALAPLLSARRARNAARALRDGSDWTERAILGGQAALA